MNKRLQKAVKKYQKAQDVFKNTQHDVRKAVRLQWKDANLDADVEPKGYLNTQVDVKKWSELSSPFKLTKDYPKPSGFINDQNVPNFNNMQNYNNR